MGSMDEDPKTSFNEKNKTIDALDDLFCFSSSSSESDNDVDLNVISNDIEEPKTSTFISPKELYSVVGVEEIRQYQERDIKQITDVLSITAAEASILLLQCNWSVNTVINRWFTNEVKFREELGLPEIYFAGVDTSDGKAVTCGLCSQMFSQEQVAAPSCGHKFCIVCLAGYIGTSLQYGLASLLLRCPQSSCKIVIDRDMINTRALDADKALYDHYFLRSYIEYNPKAKWCPVPGCNHAVILVNINSFPKVTCNCSYSFCWRCAKEAHQPVSCLVAGNWGGEFFKQTENRVMNNKSCPNCRNPFEVNGTFKRVECTTCKAQFCRLCFGSWLDNGFWEGDQYTHTCNKGKQKATDEGEDEERRKALEESSMKYEVAFVQWKTNDMHLQAALKEIQELKRGHLKAVALKQRISEAEVNFVIEAWLQIADSKRFFKWLSVHMYYLSKYDVQKIYVVNYLQRQGEVVLEQLYQILSELPTFFTMEEPSIYFSQFCSRLCLITSVTRNYFDNMIWAVENGESDLNELRRSLRSRMMGLAQDTPGPTAGYQINSGQGQWTCAHCQFPNEDTSLCVMCYR